MADGLGRWRFVRDRLIAGGLSGVIGGLLMGVFCAVLLAFIPPHEPLAAARWLGEGLSRGALGGSLATIAGVVVHLGVAGGLGTGFALLLPRGGTAVAALGCGVAYALLLVPVMTWAVASWLAPGFFANLEPGVLAMLHLPFGASLALVVSLRHLLTGAQRLVLRARRAQRLLGERPV